MTPDEIAAKYGGQAADADAVAAKYGGSTGESTYASRAVQAGLRGAPGGPLGIAASMGAHGLDELGRLSDRYGYEAGGAVTDVAGKVLPPEAAAGVGVATNLALSQGIPAMLGGGAAKAVASPLMRRASEYFMRRALNPTKFEWMTGKGERAVQTMLDEPFGKTGKILPGANVHEVGVEQLRGKAGELADQVQQALQGSPETINKLRVAGGLLKNRMEALLQPSWRQDVKDIYGVGKEFLTNPLAPGKEIPVELAHKIKQGAYESLGSAEYGKKSDAWKEATKTIARRLKEAIEQKHPEVAGPLAKESELRNALEMAARSAAAKPGAGGIGWISHNLPTFLAYAGLHSPLAQSMTARGLNVGKNVVPYAAGGFANAAITAPYGQAPDEYQSLQERMP